MCTFGSVSQSYCTGQSACHMPMTKHAGVHMKDGSQQNKCPPCLAHHTLINVRSPHHQGVTVSRRTASSACTCAGTLCCTSARRAVFESFTCARKYKFSSPHMERSCSDRHTHSTCWQLQRACNSRQAPASKQSQHTALQTPQRSHRAQHA